jgi:transposase-like protein
MEDQIHRDHDYSQFCCPNPNCQMYGKRGERNIRPHGWSSKKRNIRMLRCRVCRTDFSQRKGTPLFRTRLPEEKLVSIVEHLAEGNGMRATGRLCGVALNTVLSFALRAGEHAEQFHDEMVRHVRVSEAQADEAWAFVGKKTKALRRK